MKLPIQPPYLPMEAEHADDLPVGDDWHYEPILDGRRCLVFRDGDEIELQSKHGEPLTHRFSAVANSMLGLGAQKFVLDGAIIAPNDTDDAAHFVAFDLLVTERATLLVQRRLIERRDRLETFAARHFDSECIQLSPRTWDVDVARQWLRSADVCGVIAKDIEAPYVSGRRAGMRKVKAKRS